MNCLSRIPGWLWWYGSVEVLFHVIYTWYLIPRANQRTPPAPYRDYRHNQDRHKLLLRILSRMERTCERTHSDFYEYLNDFLEQWVHPAHTSCSAGKDQDKTQRVTRPGSSPTRVGRRDTGEDAPDHDSVCNHEDNDDDEENKHPVTLLLTKQSADEFFSWAFFNKQHDELRTGEAHELEYMFQLLRDRYNLHFSPSSSSLDSHDKTRPSGEDNVSSRRVRRLSLEDVSPWHRPLLVYVCAYGMHTLGGLVFRCMGYRRYTTTNGLTYWHAPPAIAKAAQQRQQQQLPLLFFHGIAPGGLSVYIPFVGWGLGCFERRRHVFLFENEPISCRLTFDALSEDETVDGVAEALDAHLPLSTNTSSSTTSPLPFALAGHSFGSCALTWLLQSKQLRGRIRQLILIDPVTILLSEPDVLNNFLYSRSSLVSLDLYSHLSFLTQLRTWWRRNKIHLVASSELCTEHYLRRHFAWYNSELWLDTIPSNVEVLVCLSEDDEIIHTPKVMREIEGHNDQCQQNNGAPVQLLYWRGVGHAHCLLSNREWKGLQHAMEQQEERVWMEEKRKLS